MRPAREDATSLNMRRRIRRTFPCTTACSPHTMTFPGAETMKAGIMGLDFLRSIFPRWFTFMPLVLPLLLLPLMPFPLT